MPSVKGKTVGLRIDKVDRTNTDRIMKIMIIVNVSIRLNQLYL